MSGGLLAVLEHPSLPILLTVGFALFVGTLGAKLFQRLRIPQVVGYIVIGAAVGQMGLNFLDTDTIRRLQPFNFFALGIIGFSIGGELHREVFQKFGRQFFAVLLAEGLGAFLLVTLLVTGVSLLFFPPVYAVALGLLLGAISSATAPAATVDVLWEYKTRGVLTTTVFAIVALDDALALLLFGLAASVAGQLVGTGEGGMGQAVLHAVVHLGGGLLIGTAGGFGLYALIRWARDPAKSLTFIIGTLGVVIGLARMLDVDLILAAMALGAVLANVAPRRSKEGFELVERFAPPIYVLFFVIVGARLTLVNMPGYLWLLVGVFVVGRSVGKIVGSNIGARIGGAAESVRKYLGLCLFSQAGVAIGLAILAADTLGEGGTVSQQLASAVIMIVTATTFLVQMIGPSAVKYAVKQAGEVGLNVTEDDLVASYTVGEVMDDQPTTFPEHAALSHVLPTIAETEALSYPVVDENNSLSGILTIEHLKSTFAGQGISQWVVAFDLMEPAPATTTPKAPLAEALGRMKELGLTHMPVVDTGGGKLVGLLEERAVSRFLSAELLRRRQLAEGAPA
jgi:Kef-type K+ transport system membrane component KefB